MSYFATSAHVAIKADPTYITTLWNGSGQAFKNSLGSGFNAEIDEHFKLGFCAMVAYDMFPYGESTSVELEDILLEDALDCDNYVALTMHLFEILVPTRTTYIRMVGVEGGPVGNHAQIFCEKAADSNGAGGGAWVIDPTFALFQCGYTFDNIFSGMPASSTLRKSLRWRTDTSIDSQNNAVIAALNGGQYKPSHQLYCFDDLQKFLNPPSPSTDWPTPAANKRS